MHFLVLFTFDIWYCSILTYYISTQVLLSLGARSGDGLGRIMAEVENHPFGVTHGDQSACSERLCNDEKDFAWVLMEWEWTWLTEVSGWQQLHLEMNSMLMRDMKLNQNIKASGSK